VLTATLARAEQGTESPPCARPIRVDLAVDPTPFALSGWSIEVMLKPAGLGHWRFGAEALHARLPSFLLAAAGNDGWSARPTGAMATVDYFFAADGRGAFVGLVASAYDWELGAPSGGVAHALFLEPEARVGYQWLIPRTPIFLQPWAGVAVPIKAGGHTNAGAEAFHQLPAIPFGAVDVGLEL
jgi:hypothetical protein